MEETLILLVCDSVAWRLDRFVDAAARLGAAADRSRPGPGGLTLGDRSRDDLAFIVCDGVPESAAGDLVEAAGLTGLRRLMLPARGTPASEVRARGLAACDVVVELRDPRRLEAELRTALGLVDDPRAAVRVGVQWRVRLVVGGTWVEGRTRDIASGGLFVETELLLDPGLALPMELFVPGEPWPLTGQLTVVRCLPGGFGGRLSLAPAQEERLAKAVRRVRPAPVQDLRRHEPRVPARLAVRFDDASELAAAWTANLSRGGMFVRSEEPPPEGSSVRLVLTTPTGASFTVGVRVTHVVQASADGQQVSGCGAIFEDIPADARAWIDGYLAAALLQPRVQAVVADADGRRT